MSRSRTVPPLTPVSVAREGKAERVHALAGRHQRAGKREDGDAAVASKGIMLRKST
jgi:hypothetical protein